MFLESAGSLGLETISWCCCLLAFSWHYFRFAFSGWRYWCYLTGWYVLIWLSEVNCVGQCSTSWRALNRHSWMDWCFYICWCCWIRKRPVYWQCMKWCWSWCRRWTGLMEWWSHVMKRFRHESSIWVRCNNCSLIISLWSSSRPPNSLGFSCLQLEVLSCFVFVFFLSFCFCFVCSSLWLADFSFFGFSSFFLFISFYFPSVWLASFFSLVFLTFSNLNLSFISMVLLYVKRIEVLVH